MSIKFTQLGKILAITIIASSVSGVANAEEMKSLHQEFRDAYFSRGKDAFHQSNMTGQFNTMFGLTGFPDQHIAIDGKRVDQVYQSGIAEQSSMGPRMVTRDLPNPYDTSLFENPSLSAIK